MGHATGTFNEYLHNTRCKTTQSANVSGKMHLMEALIWAQFMEALVLGAVYEGISFWAQSMKALVLGAVYEGISVWAQSMKALVLGAVYEGISFGRIL